jgi:hypothetical protein
MAFVLGRGFHDHPYLNGILSEVRNGTITAVAFVTKAERRWVTALGFGEALTPDYDELDGEMSE